MSERHVYTHDGQTVSVVLPASPEGYLITWEGTDDYPITDASVWRTHAKHVSHPTDAAQMLGARYANIRATTCEPAPLDIPRGTPLRDVH